MCGITGWIDWNRDLTRESDTIRRMAATLACRGPDASTQWLSPRAAFGHRRLIVVDPAGGGQPMRRQRDGREYVLVYNGELYNTPELRRELEARGHVFQGHSDTEALLLSYIEWGPACVERFNGIFAFAVWDSGEESLFMARDRLGVKPLFFTQRGSMLLFGSELKAILAHPDVEPVVDRDGLAEVFALGPARTPGHGVFKGIEELKPGWSLRFSRDGLRAWPYWQLESRPHEDDERTTVATVRELFLDAVERQLVADVPVCTLLSGGLDSSALTAGAVRVYRRDGRGELHTYSVDYEDNDRYFRPNDFQPDADGPWIDAVSRHLGTRHHRVCLDTASLAEALVPAMRARDLPGMADIDASLLLFCKEIKKDATVALSGECADEVFCGYPWFRRDDAISADTFPWSLKVGERLQVMSEELKAHARPLEYIQTRYQEALDEVPRLPGETGRAARMREIAYLTLTRWMPTLLDRKDRMSMAVGLEVRVPFCDHRLVEYVWNVPWELKTLGGREKGLLRRALQGLLPDDVLWRRKSPYPKTFHPGYLAAMRERVLGILDDPASPLLPLIDVKAVRAMAESDVEFDIPWFGQLMRLPQLFAFLVQVDAWLREYRVRLA
ncbi:MAG: asparagine synthase (glutamine-hydrolyzing) [Clostridia bacterium]|nr:asparagine synthase (glutamine-hydrolyzing) [Clostridia bacterium]